MHKVSFPVSFVSRSSISKETEDGQRNYYFVNLLAQDGNIDRFFIDHKLFSSLDACILGDVLTVNARLFFAPKSAAWALKIDSLIPSSLA